MSSNNSGTVECNIKTPKRVLYFSDGVLEEYDEETDQKDSNENNSEKQIVLENFPLVSYLANSVFWFGYQTLKACDYIGENLANLFGITSPKYQYEIDEYNRIVEEENNLQTKQSEEFSGWTQSDSNKNEINLTDKEQKPEQINIDLEKQKF